MNCRHDNCFSCPYSDCIASNSDISKKSKAERDKSILEDFNNGVSVNGIAERLGLTSSAVRSVLKKAGITNFRQEWEVQSERNHNRRNSKDQKHT